MCIFSPYNIIAVIGVLSRWWSNWLIGGQANLHKGARSENCSRINRKMGSRYCDVVPLLVPGCRALCHPERYHKHFSTSYFCICRRWLITFAKWLNINKKICYSTHRHYFSIVMQKHSYRMLECILYIHWIIFHTMPVCQYFWTYREWHIHAWIYINSTANQVKWVAIHGTVGCIEYMPPWSDGCSRHTMALREGSSIAMLARMKCQDSWP